MKPGKMLIRCFNRNSTSGTCLSQQKCIVHVVHISNLWIYVWNKTHSFQGRCCFFYPWSLIFVRHPYMLLLPHGRFSNSIICLVWPLMASLEGSKNARALSHYQIRKGFQRHRIGKNTCTTFFQWFKSYNKDHLTTYISWLNIRWHQQKKHQSM